MLLRHGLLLPWHNYLCKTNIRVIKGKLKLMINHHHKQEAKKLIKVETDQQ